MRKLEDAIRQMGIGIGSDIVKVDMFLNHRIDVGLLREMGQEIARHFEKCQPDIILTVEASGIALAVAASYALSCIPVVFAKKAKASNQDESMLEASVYSFTHQKNNVIRVSADYLPQGARVLIVDDFLANAQAVMGLMSIIQQAKCHLCGVAVAVEKGFQPGGQLLREQGVDLLSLAVVSSIQDGKIELAQQPENF